MILKGLSLKQIKVRVGLKVAKYFENIIIFIVIDVFS